MITNRWLSAAAFVAAAICAGGCASTGNDVNTSILPSPAGNGVVAQVDVEFTSVAELPGKVLKGLGDALVSVTQPMHPYHYLRDEKGRIKRDDEGSPQKVWLPFWRVIGKHHGDSVVGLVYDHGWFGGWSARPRDKLGKAAGLALLIWGASELLEDSDDGGGHGSPEHIPYTESEPQQEPSNEQEERPAIPDVTPPTNPPTTPEIPPVVDPDGWDLGTGGPVGGVSGGDGYGGPGGM